MWARIIFCTSVSLAVLVVILLALFSPIPHPNNTTLLSPPWLDLSLYIQQPHIGTKSARPVSQPDAGALVFHRTLTEGPESTSRAVGKAQGFIIPADHFAHSDFNVVYLSFDTPEYSGSLGVHAKRIAHHDSEALAVVGGTGSFAFARGLAIFAAGPTDEASRGVGVADTFHVKLHLTFPNQSRSTNIQG